MLTLGEVGEEGWMGVGEGMGEAQGEGEVLGGGVDLEEGG